LKTNSKASTSQTKTEKRRSSKSKQLDAIEQKFQNTGCDVDFAFHKECVQMCLFRKPEPSPLVLNYATAEIPEGSFLSTKWKQGVVVFTMDRWVHFLSGLESSVPEWSVLLPLCDVSLTID